MGLIKQKSNAAVLAVGGAGYVGSHTVAHLVRRGYKVIVYDSCVKGHKDAVVRDAVFVDGDVSDKDKLKKVFTKYRPSVVFFFAAYSIVPESISSPHKYYANNIVNLLTLLDVMNKYNCRRFIFSSSAAIYGQPDKMPITEDFPSNPIQTYGDTKLIAEEILTAFKKHGIKATYLRYFNVFGASPDADLGEDHSPETHIVPLLMELPLIELITKEIIRAESESAVMSEEHLKKIQALLDREVPQISEDKSRAYIGMKELVIIYETLRKILLEIRKDSVQGVSANQDKILVATKELLRCACHMGLSLDGSIRDPVTGKIIPPIQVDTEDGTPVRDYIDVANDLALAHELAFTKELEGNYNCGTNTGYSAKQIVEGVKEVLRQEFPDIENRLIVVNGRRGDPTRLVASYDKLHKVTGWKPQTPYIKSLGNAWNFLKTHLTGYGDEPVVAQSCEAEDTQATIKSVEECSALPQDLKFEILFRFLIDIFESESQTSTEAADFSQMARSILNTHNLGEYEKSVLENIKLVKQFTEALNKLKNITGRRAAIQLAHALGITKIIEEQVRKAVKPAGEFEYINRYEILTKPKDFVAGKRIIRKHGAHFDAMNGNDSKILVRQLKAIKNMWEKFEASMKNGPRYDILIFDTEEHMHEINRTLMESLRGIVYHEDTIIILVVNPDGYFKDNLNATIAEMKIVRDKALPQLGLNKDNLKINHILLAGKGTRNEMLTHALGLGGKHIMFNPSALSYVATTIIQSYQVFINKPHWLGRFNDQILLITNQDMFSGNSGLVTGGIRYKVSEQMRSNCNHIIRNNCLMKLDNENNVLATYEKPLGIGNNPTDRNGLAYYTDGKGRLAGSLSVRRFTPEGVDALIEEFTKINGITGNYIYRALRLNENTVLVGGSTFGDEERDNFWAAHDHCQNVRYENVISAINAAHLFKERVGIGFGDFGPEEEAMFVDTGNNSSYYQTFAGLKTNKPMQALLDVVPDVNGNVVIESGVEIQSLLKGRKGVFACYCPNLREGHISDDCVLLNVIAKNITTESGCLVGPVYEDGKVVRKGEIFAQIYQKEEEKPVDIRWKIEDNPNSFFEKQIFNSDKKKKTYNEIKEKQDKQRTIHLLRVFGFS